MCSENKNPSPWPRNSTFKLFMIGALIGTVPRGKAPQEFRKDGESTQKRQVKARCIVGEVT